jgi:hypothetical protein
MAKIFPTLDVITKGKVPPTEGELHLLNYLSESFDVDAEVYFQPFFNGDRPDIIIIHKIKGIIIIEVKDWHLSSYFLDEKNDWHVKKNGAVIRSPFAQVFAYKKNIFEIHVNGLLEKKLKNPNFYKIISCFVYFYCESKESLECFFKQQIENYKIQIKENLTKHQQGLKTDRNFDAYEKKDKWLNGKLYQFTRDLFTCITKDQLGKKLQFPFRAECVVYPESVYQEILRNLNPPYHYANQGAFIEYTKKQAQLVISSSGRREKIKGVAGSGKTTVLAKLAVNAHKRHGGRVLILTFNLTLKSYIHDKISEVREAFNWGFFDIINYHKFMSMSFNRFGKNISRDEDIDTYYSDESAFDGCEIEPKYQTILIDEVQDYKPEWVKIIRKYFLAIDGEMVLFGDEKQNIYEREVDERKMTRTPNGFGAWQELWRGFRYNDYFMSHLASDFRELFFKGNEESVEEEDIDIYKTQPMLIGMALNQCVVYQHNQLLELVTHIFKLAKINKVHPNDMVILSSNITQMVEIDFLIRTDENFNEKTLTTFEVKEGLSPTILDKDIKKIRASKKFGFNHNSGVLKISTIHSFKGYESPTVFLIINERDSAELVYVGLTRAKFNLVVFVPSNSRFEKFFKEHLDTKLPYETLFQVSDDVSTSTATDLH